MGWFVEEGANRLRPSRRNQPLSGQRRDADCSIAKTYPVCHYEQQTNATCHKYVPPRRSSPLVSELLSVMAYRNSFCEKRTLACATAICFPSTAFFFPFALLDVLDLPMIDVPPLRRSGSGSCSMRAQVGRQLEDMRRTSSGRSISAANAGWPKDVPPVPRS